MTTQAVTTRSINVLPVNGNPVTNIDLNQKYKIIVQGLTGNDETLLKNGNYFLKNNTLFSDENCSTTLANLQKGRSGQYRVLVKTELTSSTAIENVALQIVMPEITQAAPAPVVEAPVAAPAPVVEEAPVAAPVVVEAPVEAPAKATQEAPQPEKTSLTFKERITVARLAIGEKLVALFFKLANALASIKTKATQAPSKIKTSIDRALLGILLFSHFRRQAD